MVSQDYFRRFKQFPKQRHIMDSAYYTFKNPSLDRLSGLEKKIYELYDVGQWTVTEIAIHFGWSVKTARFEVNKVMEKIKEANKNTPKLSEMEQLEMRKSFLAAEIKRKKIEEEENMTVGMYAVKLKYKGNV